MSIGNFTNTAAAYDLVAVTPTTEKSFANVCEKGDVDIVCIRLGDRLDFRMKPAQIKAAIARGMVFEITCQPMLGDSGARKNMIGNARLITRIAHPKHLLLTSGARDRWQVRSPTELAAMYEYHGVSCGVGESGATCRKQGSCVCVCVSVNVGNNDSWTCVCVSLLGD